MKNREKTPECSKAINYPHLQFHECENCKLVFCAFMLQGVFRAVLCNSRIRKCKNRVKMTRISRIRGPFAKIGVEKCLTTPRFDPCP